MRRMRNSVKAIIISICLVVVLAGSVVGLVLANRNKGGKGEPTNPNNPVNPIPPEKVYELTEDQKKLGEAINKSAQTSVEIAPTYNYSSYVDAEGNGFDFDKIDAFYENYFTYQTDVGTTLMVRNPNVPDKAEYFDILSKITEDEEIVSAKIASVNDKKIYLWYVAENGAQSNFILKRIVLDLNDFVNIKIIKTYEDEFETIDKATNCAKHETKIILSNKYYVSHDIVNDSFATEIEISRYNNQVLFSYCGEFSIVDNSSYQDECYYLIINENLHTGVFVDDDFFYHTYTEQYDILYDYSIYKKSLFVEKIQQLNSEKVYSYSIIDLVDGDAKSIVLDDGYSKAYLNIESNEKYYSIFQQKKNKNNDGFDEVGLMTYFDENHNIVVKYLTNSASDKIIYYKGVNFLTPSALYSTKKSLEAEIVKEFGNDVTLYSETINLDTFVLFKNSKYSIYNLKGERVFDESWESICVYNDGIYAACTSSEYYLLNVKNKSITKIDNFYIDENYNNHILLMYGGGYYFAKAESDEFYKMYDYKLNLISENVVDYRMINKATTHLIVKYNSGKESNFILSSNINIENESAINYDNIITDNYFIDTWTHGDNWKVAAWVVDGKDNFVYVQANKSTNCYISDARVILGVGCGHTNVVIKLTYNYSTGVGTCTHEYDNEYDEASKNEVTGSFIKAVYHEEGFRLIFQVQWDDGDYICDSAHLMAKPQWLLTVPNLYCEINSYAHKTDKVYESSSYVFTTDIKSPHYMEYETTTIKYGSSPSNKFTPKAKVGSSCIGGVITGYTPLLKETTTNTTSYSGKEFKGKTSLYTSTSDEIAFNDGITYSDIIYSNTKKIVLHTYALYRESKYTITVDYDGALVGDQKIGDYSKNIQNKISVTCDSEVEFASDKFVIDKLPQLAGYRFYGWEISGDCYYKTTNVGNMLCYEGSATNIIGEPNTILPREDFKEIKFYSLCSKDGGSITITPCFASQTIKMKFIFGESGLNSSNFLTQDKFFDTNNNYQVYSGSAFTDYYESQFNVINNVDNTTIVFDPDTGRVIYDKYEGIEYKDNLGFYNKHPMMWFNFVHTESINDRISGVRKDYYTTSALIPYISNTKNENFIFSIQGVPYVICDWAYYNKSTNESVEVGYHLLSKSTHQFYEIWDSDRGEYFELYAVVKKREYNITATYDDRYGYGSLKDENSERRLNETYISYGSESNYPLVNYSVQDTKNATVDGNKIYTFSGETVAININLKNYEEQYNASNNKNYYVFDMIVIYGVGYKSGSSYKFADIILKNKRDDGGWFVYINNGAGTTLNDKRSYLQSSIFNNSASSLDGGYYKVDTGYNWFKISNTTNNSIQIEFTNLGYAGKKIEDENGIESIQINSDYATGDGTEGFVIKSYLMPNYKISDIVTNTSDDLGDFTKVSTVPVKDETIYYKDGEDTKSFSVRYFWLYGRKFVLTEGAGFSNNNISSEAVDDIKEGYYILWKYDSLTICPSSNSLFYCNEGMIKEYVAIQSYPVNDEALTFDNVYYDKNNIYYLTNNTNNIKATYDTTRNTNGLMNYNSTEIVAIRPEQDPINYSKNPSSLYSGINTYELKSYLKNIKIGGTEFEFSISREFNGKQYSEFSELRSGCETCKSSGKINGLLTSISYLGRIYKVHHSYKLVDVNVDGTREYILYFTSNETDNEVMYFLYSNVGDNGCRDITLTFEDKKLNVNATMSDYEDNQDSYNIAFYQDTIDVVYGDSTDRFSSDNNFASIEYYKYYKKDDIYDVVVTPRDTLIIKINPTDGYLINTLSLKLGGNVIFNFALNYAGMTYKNTKSDRDEYYSYLHSSGSAYEISYNSSKYKNFNAHGKLGSGDNSGFAGIRWSEYIANTWNGDDSVNFETIYIMISGIYHDVSIVVETISYIEFGFNDNKNDLGLDISAPSIGSEFAMYQKVTNNNGTQDNTDDYIEYVYKTSYVSGYKFVKLEVFTEAYAYGGGGRLYKKVGNSFVKDIYGNHVLYDTEIVQLYKIVDYTITPISDGETYNGTKYKITVTDISDLYPHMQSGDKFLSKVTKLSILDGSNNKLGISNNQIQIDGNNYVNDASFVRTYNAGTNATNLIRVVFLGKSKLFEKGVKIFATGEDYSAYFTNGKLYQDDGNDANGLNAGITAFSYLSDAEGRKPVDDKDEQLKALYIDRVSGSQGCSNLEFGDYLTYMQIDNIKNYFGNSLFSRSIGNDEINKYEFARKYMFFVNVGKNEVSSMINSYISNDNLSDVSEGDNTNPNQIDNYYNQNSGLNNTLGNATSIVNSSNKIKIQSDGRNQICIEDDDKQWDSTVIGRLSPYVDSYPKTFSPIMWINDQVYQLDYVDTIGGYSKQQSWFNDTVLTNIYYNYNGQPAINGSNWQKVDKRSSTAGNARGNPTVQGFGSSYRYYAIPGYHLDYIVVETVDYGSIYIKIENQDEISLGEEIKKVEIEVDSGSFKTTDTNVRKIYYKLVHGRDEANGYYYDLKLYNEDSDVNNVNNMQSIGLMSNDITVNFFSKAYSGEIVFNTNVGSENISSNTDLEGKQATQVFYYDTMTTLDPGKYWKNSEQKSNEEVFYSFGGLLMDGYTFLGWGSDNYGDSNRDNGTSRFDSTNLTWNSSSKWKPIKGDFEIKNRSNLIDMTDFGYDFYLKSMDEIRSKTTGWFVTDTGNSTTENYNFWAAYRSIFNSSMSDKYANSTTASYQIPLYAIWKANTYAVEFDFNDSMVNNGSTASVIGNLTEVKNGIKKYNWGSYIKENPLKNVFKYEDDKYYCFVTYDKNDWYFTDDIYSNLGHRITGNNCSMLREGNYLNYIIDRYGYKWLGWFSDKINDLKEGTSLTEQGVSDKVFGSDYYYSTKNSSDVNKTMPYIRNSSYTKNDEWFIKISDFATSKLDIYSEPVYKREAGVGGVNEDLNDNDKLDSGEDSNGNGILDYYDYVYHYDYKGGGNATDGFVASDYLNAKNDAANNKIRYDNKNGNTTKENDENYIAFVEYDTSLSLNSYRFRTYNSTTNKYEIVSNLDTEKDNCVIISRDGLNFKGDSISGDTNNPIFNYRFITLYAYWSVNNYKVVIDYRDDSLTQSVDKIGSSEVTNKSEINTAVDNVYFDTDVYLNYAESVQTSLEIQIPTRVGYDFLGWSFYFVDRDLLTGVSDLDINDTIKNKHIGDLFKYNGFTYAANSYVLNNSLITTENFYYMYEINGGAKKISEGGIYPIYTSGTLLENGKATDLLKSTEVYGDGEADDSQYVYIFAMWRAQKFTINASLNIDNQDLHNGYDKDSSYTLGFYQTEDVNGNDVLDEGEDLNVNGNIDKYNQYVGVNSNFLKQKKIPETYSKFNDVFTEIVSNVVFEITFDESFETAIYRDPNDDSKKTYYLKDLFATSTGYYFINWLYNTDNTGDTKPILIANSLESSFGYNSELVNKKIDGNQEIKSAVSKLNYEMYNKLYRSDYKDVTYVPNVGPVDFAASNYTVLNNKDFVSGAHASTNFGYVTIEGKEYYIYADYDEGVNVDYKYDNSNNYYLYINYNGTKYYVLIYDDGTKKSLLVNDFAYLYYQTTDTTPIKYIVRYDYQGNAYYVPNTTYTDKMMLNLKIAIFESLRDAKFTNIGVNSDSDLTNAGRKFAGANNNYTSCTTRQFTIFADWELKEAESSDLNNRTDDFYISMVNGNNIADPDIINGQVENGHNSNPGLAGYFEVYKKGKSSNSLLFNTLKTYSAGGEASALGEEQTRLSRSFTFGDSFVVDLIPYFNGRFLTELTIDFDRMEDVGTTTTVTTSYKKVSYRLVLNYSWDSANQIITIDKVSLLVKKPGTLEYDDNSCEVTLSTPNNSSDSKFNITYNAEDVDVEKLKTYLSVIDTVAFGGTGAVGSNNFFDIYEYGVYGEYDQYGNKINPNDPDGYDKKRRDVNKVSFELDDVMSSVTFTYKYALQTYDLKVHHLFDTEGDNLVQTLDDGKFTTNYKEADFITDQDGKTNIYDNKESLDSTKVYLDTSSTGSNKALATVPTDLTTTTSSTTYNIPYGYFIYGYYYTSKLQGQTPMYEYHENNYSASYGGSRVHEFDGFDYVYSKAYYVKGKGGAEELVLDADYHNDQGSPILGSPVTFQSVSIMLNKTFYKFKGWYERDGLAEGLDTVMFNSYDVNDEIRFINRDIVLYGYYFSSNSPTNLQFYTWNDSWSDSSPAYLPYLHNKEEFTLSGSEHSSAYTFNEDKELIPSGSKGDYIDADGRVILKTLVEYGVDSSKFNNDGFTTNEIGITEVSSLLKEILKTYWYNRKTYDVLRYEDGGGTEYYVKFDKAIETKYYYTDVNEAKFSAKNALLFVNDGSEFDADTLKSECTILATNIIVNESLYNSGIGGSDEVFEVGTITYNGNSNTKLYYNKALQKYYFKGDRYYFFDIQDKAIVESRFFESIDTFYYDSGSGLIPVIVRISQDMSKATIKIWNDGVINAYGAEKDLVIEPVEIRDYLGSELYYFIEQMSNKKYYKYHRVTDDMISDSADGSFLKKFKPRYYVDIEGKRYYTFIHEKADSSYKFAQLYYLYNEGLEEKVSQYAGAGGSVTTLNNYYILFNDEYHYIEYTSALDDGGSKYYNPYGPNEISLDYKDTPGIETIYFNYNNYTKTSGLYEKCENGRYLGPIYAVYTIYTPINANYTLKPVAKGNIWQSSDITLNSFPSLNMDHWYDDPEYILLGYLNVTDRDIETMKTAGEDDGSDVYSESQYEYLSTYKQLIEIGQIDKYLLGKESFSDFATLDFANSQAKINLGTGTTRDLTLSEILAGNIYSFIDSTDNTMPEYYIDMNALSMQYSVVQKLNVSGDDEAFEASGYYTIYNLETDKTITAYIVEKEHYDLIKVDSTYDDYKDAGNYLASVNFDVINRKMIINNDHTAATNDNIDYYIDDEGKGYYKCSLDLTDDGENNPTNLYIERSKVIVKQKATQGGQIYQAYKAYIDKKYTNTSAIMLKAFGCIDDDRNADATKLTPEIEARMQEFRDKLLSAVASKIATYALTDLLKFPMHVESFEFNPVDYKTIERVNMRVSVEFNFSEAEIIKLGLDGYNIDGLIVDEELTISTSFIYSFNLLTKDTQINQNVYAIPIYLPDVIKYTGESLNLSESKLQIDYSKMNISHYDVESYRVYRENHAQELLDAYNGGDLTKDPYLQKVDYLNFVMLNSLQFGELCSSSIGCDVKLESIVSRDRLISISRSPDVSYDDNLKQNIYSDLKDIEFDLSGLVAGRYYILSYYNSIDKANASEKHIQRVSDNIIEVIVAENGNISYSIIDNPRVN